MIDATWIQSGELGLAFVVIVLCVYLVRYTINQSAERERRLMEMLTQQQTLTDRQGDILQKLAAHMDTYNERLNNIERVIDEKMRSKPRATRKASTQ